MKFLTKFMATVCLAAGLTACSSEDGPGTEPTPEPQSGFYSQITFRLPQGSRSTASEGNEVGQNDENNVGSILVVLATQESAGADYKFLTYSLNDSPITGGNNTTHTIVFQDRDKLFAQANNIIHIFAYCNPTEELRAVVEGLAEGASFIDEICSANVTGTWKSNAFLMTSAELASKQLPDEATLRTYNTPTHAFPLGEVQVMRTASRFDFRDASSEIEVDEANEAYTQSGANTYPIFDQNRVNEAGKHPLVAEVTFTRVALFNIRKQFYYLPRISTVASESTPAAVTLCPGKLGMETADTYVVCPDEATYSYILPDAIDPLNPANAGLEWAELNTVLGNTENNKDGWGNDLDAAKKNYHIWRYGIENAFGAIESVDKNATTGYVFEAEIKPREGFGNVREDGTLEVMYLYNNVMYGSAAHIAAEVENYPVSTLATAFKAAFTETDGVYTPVDDETLKANGFTAYKPNTEGKYLCYYFAYNKHNEDGDPTSVGLMEFGTVRNNIYKLAVTSVKKFGSFEPGNPDDWNVYFTLDIRVLDWTVRINNLEF